MYVQTAYKNVRRSHDLEDYAVSKIQSKVDQFIHKPIGIHVTFHADGPRESIQCQIRAGDGLSVVAKETGSNFYEATDQLIEKIAKQLAKKKDQYKSHRKNRPLKLVVAEKAEDLGDPGTELN